APTQPSRSRTAVGGRRRWSPIRIMPSPARRHRAEAPSWGETQEGSAPADAGAGPTCAAHFVWLRVVPLCRVRRRRAVAADPEGIVAPMLVELGVGQASAEFSDPFLAVRVPGVNFVDALHFIVDRDGQWLTRGSDVRVGRPVPGVGLALVVVELAIGAATGLDIDSAGAVDHQKLPIRAARVLVWLCSRGRLGLTHDPSSSLLQ